MKSKFSSKYNVFVDVRHHHEALLRPELGSVNHQEELNHLNQSEYDRSKEVEVLIQSTRQKLLILCKKHAHEFHTQLNENTAIFLFIMDSIVMEKDLLVYEDEVVVKTKRKTLKSMRKIRLNKEMKSNGTGNESSETKEGFRGPRKKWNGIPIHKLSLFGLDVKLGKLIGDAKEYSKTHTPVVEQEGNEEDGESASMMDDDDDDDKYLLPTDEEVLNMTKIDDVRGLILKLNKKTKGKKLLEVQNELIKILPPVRIEYEGLIKERDERREERRLEQLELLNSLSESMESYRTHAHSCVLKGRLHAFNAMMKEFTNIVMESDKGMDHMLEELIRKEHAWNDQVKYVVDTCLK